MKASKARRKLSTGSLEQPIGNCHTALRNRFDSKLRFFKLKTQRKYYVKHVSYFQK